MFRFAAAAIAALALTAGVNAAPLKIGEPAPKFSGLECATTGKSASLEDFKGKDVLVVVVTCNHCPVAIAYEDRLVAFAKKHCGKDSKVGLIAVNVNNSAADKMDKMQDRSKSKGFNFPYLYDPSQKIAKDLGATRTPEFFVFDKERRLVYTGAMDDNMKDASKVTKNYLEDAVLASLKGNKPATEETKAVGCGIQWDKK
ncbi:MAG: thioredoxin family protein [Gemmataceae bacterium]|nr:thioredoxin family protein [Gemmataceae bacterium]